MFLTANRKIKLRKIPIITLCISFYIKLLFPLSIRPTQKVSTKFTLKLLICKNSTRFAVIGRKINSVKYLFISKINPN